MNVVTDGTTAEPVAEKDHFVPEHQSDDDVFYCERSNFSGFDSGETWTVVPELNHEIMSQEQWLVAMLVMKLPSLMPGVPEFQGLMLDTNLSV